MAVAKSIDLLFDLLDAQQSSDEAFISNLGLQPPALVALQQLAAASAAVRLAQAEVNRCEAAETAAEAQLLMRLEEHLAAA